MGRCECPQHEGTHVDRHRRSDERGPRNGAAGRKRKGSGLDSMVLPELKQMASTLGIKGTGAMRKGQLIEAIRSAQGGGQSERTAQNGERRRVRPPR